MTNLISPRLLILQLILFSPLALYSQDIQASLQQFNNNSFGSKDIWNLNLNVNGTLPVNVKLRVTVYNQFSKMIMEAISSQITLQQNYLLLNSALASQQSMNYYDDQVRQSDLSSRSFPSGDYRFCIDVVNPVTGEVKSQNCEALRISLFTPPVLVYPSDREIIAETHPMLTWIPPGGVASGITYTLTLVELYKDQSAYDALLRNRPLVYLKDINSTSLQYPYNAPELSYEKKYAWQVEAVGTVNNISYGLSEIWLFGLTRDSLNEVDTYKDQSYIDIKQTGSNVVCYAKGFLKIKYTDKKYPVQLSYRVFDEEGNIIGDVSPLMALSKENWYDVDLSDAFKLKHKQRYRFELRDARNIYTLHFVYIDPLRVR